MEVDEKRNELCNITRAGEEYMNLREDESRAAEPAAYAGNESTPQLLRIQVFGKNSSPEGVNERLELPAMWSSI